MTLVGYPDFQEQAQWQSPPAVIYSAALANGATKIFPVAGSQLFNVSNWAATQMRIFGQFAALDVECQWYDADPPTALLGHRYFTTCANGSDSNVTLPNAGPYLRVNITNLSGFVPTLVAAIAFTNRITAPFTCPSSQPMISAQGVTIGAGVTTDFPASYLYAGPAHLHIFAAGTEAWRAQLWGQTSNGTGTLLSITDNTEAAAGVQNRRQPLIVPPLSLFVRLINNGAAPHDFYATLTPDMFR